jgi:short-subunit dehydrogenase
MARRKLENSRILLTGATRGIGESLARQIAARKAKLILVARDAARLETLAGILSEAGSRAIMVAGDITEAATRQQAVEAARDNLGGLDVLINNAGVGSLARFEESDEATLRRLMEVNFFAPVELIRLALPLLKQGQQPLIVQVGSILGRRGTPFCSAYCASKFALQGFSESLRAECARDSIDLLMANPGPTDTGFEDRRLGSGPTQPKRQTPRVSPERVARAIIRGMERGRHEVIPSWPGWLLVLANRLSPRLADAIVARFTESD